jgi:hypothetical protein
MKTVMAESITDDFMDCKSHILVTVVWSPKESTPLILDGT